MVTNLAQYWTVIRHMIFLGYHDNTAYRQEVKHPQFNGLSNEMTLEKPATLEVNENNKHFSSFLKHSNGFLALKRFSIVTSRKIQIQQIVKHVHVLC